MEVTVIGAGLAGSEAAYQLAKRGIKVKLYEMRPQKMTSAHTTGMFAELICSNSLRASSTENAVGLLKHEMHELGSIIMEAALANKVEAGGALAVDRTLFSEYITKTLTNHPNITVIHEELTTIPDGYVIVASGPLTSDKLHEQIKALVGEHLYFYDAVAPIVTKDSIDFDKVYLASRYDKGEAAYLNCPFTKEEFEKFYQYLITADCVVPHEFEMKVFEGCMPIEDMAKRGPQTLLFGPMKPVGLTNPKTGRYPYAVVQLRQDNVAGSLYNLVGFQTHLKFPAQKELLALIPGLEHANIVRYGVMHRNTYLHSPGLLNNGFQFIQNKNIFFAGQMTGVEGYVESAASGMIAGINMARILNNLPLLNLNSQTALGALACYIANPANQNFVPMNVNFGIFDNVPDGINKRNRKNFILEREALAFAALKEEVGVL